MRRSSSLPRRWFFRLTAISLVTALAAASAGPAAAASGAPVAPAALDSGILGARQTSSGWTTSQVSTGEGDSSPTIAFNSKDKQDRAYLVVVRADGLYFSRRSGGDWTTPAHIPGTREGDARPQLLCGSHQVLSLFFLRGDTSVMFASRSGSDWSKISRVDSTEPGGTISAALIQGRPAVAVPTDFGISVAYRRGSSWKYETVDHTRDGDRQPSLTGARGLGELAFVRGGSKPGIYFTMFNGFGAWEGFRRLTTSAGDRTPVLAGSVRVSNVMGPLYLVFHRQAHGLYGITRARTSLHPGQEFTDARWGRVARLPGTDDSDDSPSIAKLPEGKGVFLAFARHGDADGILTSTRSTSGYWRSPSRVTRNGLDHRPAIAVSESGRCQLVFDRS